MASRRWLRRVERISGWPFRWRGESADRRSNQDFWRQMPRRCRDDGQRQSRLRRAIRP